MFFLCRTEELKILYICLVLIIKINLRQKTSKIKFQWDAQNRSLFQEMVFLHITKNHPLFIHSFCFWFPIISKWHHFQTTGCTTYGKKREVRRHLEVSCLPDADVEIQILKRTFINTRCKMQKGRRSDQQTRIDWTAGQKYHHKISSEINSSELLYLQDKKFTRIPRIPPDVSDQT